jgi:hypothetical protein
VVTATIEIFTGLAADGRSNSAATWWIQRGPRALLRDRQSAWVAGNRSFVADPLGDALRAAASRKRPRHATASTSGRERSSTWPKPSRSAGGGLSTS